MKQFLKALNKSFKNGSQDGFSLLELVVAVGVLLVLTIGGLLAYNGITTNAREASVQKAAAEVYDGTLARYSGGASGDPMTTDDEWKESAASDSQINVDTEDLGNGRYRITASYGEDEKHKTVITTPESVNSSTPEIEAPGQELIAPAIGTCHPLVFEYFEADYNYQKFRGSPRAELLVSLQLKGLLTEEQQTEYDEMNGKVQEIFQEKYALEGPIVNNAEAYSDLEFRAPRIEDATAQEIASRILSSLNKYGAETKKLNSDNTFENPETVEELYIQLMNEQAELVTYICS